MNIKIQGGGGGAYANSGSSIGTVTYLGHEDEKREEQGLKKEEFFNQHGVFKSYEVINKIDNNKAKLKNDDAKFYVITVSPSSEEVKAMGGNTKEQSENLRKYINENLMPKYAENFKRDIKKDDIMYYAKIHHTRGDKLEDQMHAHIIVSRKDIENKKQISPLTNHRGGNTGAVKGGFDRVNFYKKAERSFDNQFSFNRPLDKSFDYNNVMKNGSTQDKIDISKKSALQQAEFKQESKNEKPRELELKQENKQQNSKGLGLSM